MRQSLLVLVLASSWQTCLMDVQKGNKIVHTVSSWVSDETHWTFVGC